MPTTFVYVVTFKFVECAASFICLFVVMENLTFLNYVYYVYFNL